jgi:hypothetical protein
MPTTCQDPSPHRTVVPTPSSENCRDAARPTTISLVPGVNIRPSVILTSGRAASAAGESPRSGTFASVPVRFSGWPTMTKSSGEAIGPSGPRSMPGASTISFASSPESPLVISVSLPDRNTSTRSGSPAPVIAALNPSAIDNTAVKTMTTPAMPMIATVDEPSRWPIERRVTPVTAKVCESQFMIVIPETVNCEL